MVLGKVECPEKRDELLKELNKRFSSEERACSVASDKGDGVGLLASGHQRTFLEVFVVVFFSKLFHVSNNTFNKGLGLVFI